MSLQIGRRLDPIDHHVSHDFYGTPAVELQLTGFEEAVADLESNVIGQFVAQSPADLKGEHRIGVGKAGHRHTGHVGQDSLTKPRWIMGASRR